LQEFCCKEKMEASAMTEINQLRKTIGDTDVD
jgi:hypothetical protein